VNHLLWQSLNARDTEEAPIVLRCREYSDTSEIDIIEWFVHDLRLTSLTDSITAQSVRDILALGGAFVIFDGLDEIIDITRRAEMVDKIEAFTRRFPLCSVLVTARRIGYQRASLHSSFQVFQLNEYSLEQVEAYAHRWFQLQGEEDRAASFLRDSRNLSDVRTNPLMLSLLCDLYRARGYIPRNRVQIYGSCADLLFYRWDSMRNVPQPPDHRQYGHELFQELALFFQRSQTARAGVEEAQLVQIISLFFQQGAGVEPLAARARAQDFLNFCADRAWLLSSRGRNQSGQRIFGFTHRTFLEYYAAVAIVRRTDAIEDLAVEVQKAYFADTGSVLCDVLTQFTQENKLNGGSRILDLLLNDRFWRGAHRNPEIKLGLCLRIANSIPLPGYLMETIRIELEKHWTADAIENNYASTVGVFDLNADARHQLVSACVEQLRHSTTPQATFFDAVIARWSRLNLMNETRFADDGWSTAMDQIIRDRITKFGYTDFDEAVLVDLVRTQDIEAVDIGSKAYCIPIFGRARPGVCLDRIFEPPALIWPETLLAENKTDITKILEELNASSRRGKIRTWNLIGVEKAAAAAGYTRVSPLASDVEVAWLCCAIYEWKELYPQLADLTEPLLGKGFLFRSFARRDAVLRDADEFRERYGATVETLTNDELHASPLRAERWFKQWVDGTRFLLNSPKSEQESAAEYVADLSLD
jgi:hypothetical protein